MGFGNSNRTILVGDNDREVCRYLELELQSYGYSVKVADDGEQVLHYVRTSQDSPSAILLDIRMPRTDGLQVLRELRKNDSRLPLILMSALRSDALTVDAMTAGATAVISKPVHGNDLRRIMEEAIGSAPATDRPPRAISRDDGEVFLGTSVCMRDLERMLAQIASSEAPVLIQGETGVGKEVIARELHSRSPRAHKPFMKLNCAALPSELIESELFGYERGAFTGAFLRKPGVFEVANEGTLLLDEIGDMDFRLQAKLLQVLQDQTFQRLGGKETTHVDVRVISATHRDLRQAIAENSFRQDLYYRLNVVTLQVPPLRERKDDIIGLAEFLLRRRTPLGCAIPQITPALRLALLEHDWPGNVRELENVLRKFLIIGDPDRVAEELRRGSKWEHAVGSATADGTPAGHVGSFDPPLLPVVVAPSALEQVARATRDAERVAILAALEDTHWNRKEAAKRLRIRYKALLYRMRRLSIRKDDPIPTIPIAVCRAPQSATDGCSGSRTA